MFFFNFKFTGNKYNFEISIKLQNDDNRKNTFKSPERVKKTKLKHI